MIVQQERERESIPLVHIQYNVDERIFFFRSFSVKKCKHPSC